MMNEYLKDNILITDGAMGTYYSELTGDNISFCEFANIDKPEIIKKIHLDYIEAGAKLIRTNTFSANSITLNISREKVKEIIGAGYSIAKLAAEGKDVFVAASIGPIHEAKVEKDNINVLDEYKFIADTFLNLGENIFIFETFSSVEYLKDITQYIKRKNKDAFILTQFAITPSGYTRKGVSISGIVEETRTLKSIDAFGFNCGSGPTHLYKAVKKLNLSDSIVSVLPNAGYPELINERTIYTNNPTYFADIMLEIKNQGVKILGGCCGTTPAHIKRLANLISVNGNKFSARIQTETREIETVNKGSNDFAGKLINNEFVVAVELDPPFDTSIEKIMEGARMCKENGVDLVTVADSPRAIVRVDSITIAAKIKREIGIDAMPHVCCRDKNQNALRSGLLAAHVEGIRNVLAVTGDPVAESDRMGTKSVFNLNSFKLIELVSEMNKEVFNLDKISVGGALNLNVLNKDFEVSRMLKKTEKGAEFFLTQPIYDEEVIEYLIKLKKEHNVKILAGIMPIVTYKNALFLNNEVPGIHIPEKYINRFNKDMTKEEAEETGIDIAVDIANKIKNYVDGLYFITPFNRVSMVMKIMNKVM
ncbi:MAG: bifunctional homocysteine S-methyltransferase/methylenetetrahydrofolate reductase [Bacillota bacterium]|nr:bifunctional homocysteine S-methyltransferase/methylenetetrahydrofolate reductase [Bacillota bacterium]